MAPHPLDISQLLHSKGENVDPSPQKSEHRHPPRQREALPSVARAPAKEAFKPLLKPPRENPPSSLLSQQEDSSVKIKPDFWSLLNEESRRMLTSRIWKGTDFNPLLAELDDLSKLTEKWLKWAVPTYVNGLQSGPIRDWLDGKREARDFHYVLVGEHLKHLKELRSKKTENIGAAVSEATEPAQEVVLQATEPLQEVVLQATEPVQEVVLQATEPVQEVVLQATEPVQEVVLQATITPNQTSSGADSSLEPKSVPKTPITEPSKTKEAAIRELDQHIAWFQAYVENKKKPSSGKP